MRILITGASGFIGSHIAQALAIRGHEVLAGVRSPDRYDGKIVGCNFAKDTRVEDWLPRLENIDVVINTVGIIRETRDQSFQALHQDAPIALFKAAEQAGVNKVIQVSALGADDGAESEYHLTKRVADDVLAGLNLDWTILRPSIVYGPGAKSWALFQALAALPFTLIVGSGQQPVQPIHVNDLVRIVEMAVDTNKLTHLRLDVVGPEPITMEALLHKHSQWLERRCFRPVHIPYGLALKLAKLGGFFGAAPVNQDTVRMLERGNTGDVLKMQKICGFAPKSIDQALEDTPATPHDRRQARFYFCPIRS